MSDFACDINELETIRRFLQWMSERPPRCIKCNAETTCPAAMDQAGREWDGRHSTADSRALYCISCGHEWIHEDFWGVHGVYVAWAAYEMQETIEKKIREARQLIEQQRPLVGWTS